MKIKINNQQSGVALLTAIMIVALASILAASLLKQLNLDISRTQNIIQNEQAYLYALGSEIIAMGVLNDDRDNSEHDSLDEYWALKLPPSPVEGGQISGSLEDLQGKFNLNNLAREINGDNQANDLSRFKRLLSKLELNQQLANAVIDWVDTDVESSSPGGAEDDFYMGLEIPYRAGNTLLSSPSELKLINGFTDEVYDKLLPYISTLPMATPININTADREVIQSISDTISNADIDVIMEQLGTGDNDPANDQPFEDIKDFVSFMKQNTSSKNFKAENIAVSTEYFLLSSVAEIGRGRVSLYSIIHRDEKSMQVISRSQGAW